MFAPLFALAVVFTVLLGVEYLWRTKQLKNGELSRKIVHVLVGVFIATWPAFMSFQAIQIVSGLMFAGVLVSRSLGIFKGIHAVKRRTYGDLLFPLSVGLVAIFAESSLIFAVAILHLSAVDGLSALVGERFGKSNSYSVPAGRKSIAGTLTCFILSFTIIGLTLYLYPIPFLSVYWPVVIWLPLAVTLLENLSPYGTDDLTLPIVVMVAMNALYILP